jgi:hypothetical protein
MGRRGFFPEQRVLVYYDQMRIPADAIIADDKLTRYLLVPRPFDDKSGFLAQAGFTLFNWAVLRQAIRALADSAEAMEDGGNEYGVFFQVRGPLVGPGGMLRVKLIWMRRAIDGRYYLVTIVPWKE